jgi:hypothetical protein
LRGASACIWQNPASTSGVTQASVPPATTASARPCRIRSAPTPMACEPVAQADTTAKLQPMAPSLLAM